MNALVPGTEPETGYSLSLRKKIKKKPVEITPDDKQ